jgi:hypothetical protein
VLLYVILPPFMCLLAAILSTIANIVNFMLIPVDNSTLQFLSWLDIISQNLDYIYIILLLPSVKFNSSTLNITKHVPDGRTSRKLPWQLSRCRWESSSSWRLMISSFRGLLTYPVVNGNVDNLRTGTWPSRNSRFSHIKRWFSIVFGMFARG